MLFRRFTDNVRSQNWMAVGLDFTILVIGLFVGLQVDDWWQDRSDRRLEQAYLEALREDFRDNADFLANVEQRQVAIIEAMLYLLEAGAVPPGERDGDRLTAAFKHIHMMPAFSPVMRTWNNLIGSGDLKLIRHRDVLDAMAAFERRIGIIQLVQNTHELELVETFQPYVIEHLDYLALAVDRTGGEFPLPSANDPAGLVDVVSDRTFRNVVVQKWTITTDLLDQTRSTREEIETVLDVLGKALGRTVPAGGT